MYTDYFLCVDKYIAMNVNNAIKIPPCFVNGVITSPDGLWPHFIYHSFSVSIEEEHERARHKTQSPLHGIKLTMDSRRLTLDSILIKLGLRFPIFTHTLSLVDTQRTYILF